MESKEKICIAIQEKSREHVEGTASSRRLPDSVPVMFDRIDLSDDKKILYD